MTTEEKRFALIDMCDEYLNCATCSLVGSCPLFTAQMSEEEINEAYDKAFPERFHRGVSYWENVCEINRRQEEKGLSKYGQTLEDNTTLMVNQRIEHLEEELIDALKYAEHLKVILADELTANDYQRAAMRTASGMQYSLFDDPNKGLLLNGVMGLNGEAGECIDIVKKSLFQGHEIDREHLIEELGDTAWYIAVDLGRSGSACCAFFGRR